ncbi:uncharacterized protein LOC126560796 [Anopheles maculipalpis]|uniref:uncharacterized protein LOC126560796 n=1 Tax=Anopheles maculipalpis TaxID=1496333 RepID=UPI0021599563|nr:uncharacterized protein LOC126560796 [Anopheles maculipalpis]
MDWTTNDKISQYYNYTCLSERNLELARLKTLYEKTIHAEHFATVEKELLNLNETLKRKLTINESNIRNVIQQDWFLEIPTDYMQKILSDFDEMNIAKRKSLDLLMLKVHSLRERYRNLLMKIFTCRIQVDTHDPRATDEKVQFRLAALQLSRCEASIRNARNVQNYYRRIGSFMFKDNLYNDRSLAALKQAIKEQMTLIRKTTLIGRSVIDKVVSLNKDLKKSTIGFNLDRTHNMKSLMYHKAILTKERIAITNASMAEVDPKQWKSRYDSITPSMDALQKEKEKLHNTIENLKHTSLTVWESKILKEMDTKTQKIMQLEKDIYENERIYKELDATTENTKHYVQGGCTLDSASMKSKQDSVILNLEEEKSNQIKLKAALARLKSLHMRLDQFFAYIPKILAQNDAQSTPALEDVECERKITISALLHLFQTDQTIEKI